jgi:adenylate cyclase
VSALAAPRQFSFRLILLLALIPLGWWALDYFGVLSQLNNYATNWLFLFRGQIPAYDRTKPDHPPLKIVYVDVDALTVDTLGERPWPREFYANLIHSVLKYGHAKAFGLDFVLSPAGMKSKLVDQDKAHDQNHKMGDAMRSYPQAVIAAVFSNIERKTSLDDLDPAHSKVRAALTATDLVKNEAMFPYIYNGNTDPKKNPYPEAPSYPVISQDYGSVGLIDVDTEFSVAGGPKHGQPDNVPRWIPMFADTEGPDATINLLWGMLDDMNLTKDDVLPVNNSYVVVDPKSLDSITLPVIQKRTFYNLSIGLALRYLGLDEKNVTRTADALHFVGNDGKELLDIPLTKGQLVEVNWFTKWDSTLTPHISASSVVNNMYYIESGKPEEKLAAEEAFKMFDNAIVLVGPVDPILQDLAPTPFDGDPVPKVGVYGNLVKTILTGKFIVRPPYWFNTVLLFVLTFVVGGLAIYKHTGLAKTFFGLVLIGYILTVFELFSHFTIALPLVAPVGSALSAAFVGTIIRLVEEERQKRRIKGMFATYLSPVMVNRMAESGQEPQLGGHNVVITIFFSDVQGFSSFSEVLTPGKLTDLMNEYLTAMTDLLQAEGGTLDKFIGDAIVAMYGEPLELKDHALRACITACRMQKRLGELRDKWKSEGDKWHVKVHNMRMRIGLNTGEAVVGNMGSSTRFNFTMMGDPVNLAARCESGAKHFGVYSMCTEDTKKAAEATSQEVLFRRLNKIIVKGKTTPVEVYEMIGLRAEATPDTLRCIELFEKALELYFAQKWDEAKAMFAEAEKLEPLQPGRDPGVAHNPSDLMQEACDEKKAHPPPADWNGVEEMHEK